MKHKQRGSIDAELTISIIALAVILLLGLWHASYQCRTQWEGSGLKSEYRIFAGCMVQKRDGKWLPAKALRDTDI